MRYFFAQALAMKDSREEFWYSPAPSDEDISKRLSHTSCLANYLMADFPLDDETIQAVIEMLSEYVHHTLDVPIRISLRQHLFQTARVEPALHVLKKFYRDHFFHAIEVAFLGHFILELRDHNGDPLWERFAVLMGCPDDKERVLRLWYVAALLHDLGYVINVQQGVRGMFKFFQHSDPLKEFGREMDQALENLSKSLGENEFVGYQKKHKPGEDHGVIGAQHLQCLLERIAKDDPSVVVEDYHPAIKAISRHNSRVFDVSFSEEPLSALLILCDTIQEWNRPRLSHKTAPLQMLSWFHNQGNAHDDLLGPLNKIDLNVDPPDEKVFKSNSFDDMIFKIKEGKKLHFRLCFDEGINRNHAVFQMWLDASANLQRLDLNGLGLSIDLEFITPLIKKPFFYGDPVQQRAERQFHRLRDAARETHMDFLDRWFPDRKSDDEQGVTNGAITYYPNSEPNDSPEARERLVLHLDELCKEKRITRDISEFHKCLGKWKRYSYSLDFLGDYAMPDYPC